MLTPEDLSELIASVIQTWEQVAFYPEGNSGIEEHSAAIQALKQATCPHVGPDGKSWMIMMKSYAVAELQPRCSKCKAFLCDLCGMAHDDEMQPDVAEFLRLRPVPQTFAFGRALSDYELRVVSAHMNHAQPILIG